MSIHNRSLTRRSNNAFKKNTRDLTLKQRFDMVLVLGLLAALALLILGWCVLVRCGWFDPPVIQPLADERILENVRDNLEADLLLDAVLHPADNHLYISQEKGVIHSYDPVTHLWDTERPFSAKDPIASDFVLLRSGCGDAPDSPSLYECPDRQALWALGTDSSLARYDGENWSIIVNNTRFVGADGAPVQAGELVAAAVGEDNNWVLLGTRRNGIGIYHTVQHRWLPPDALAGQHPTSEITRIVWWHGYFWIGTSNGLLRVEVGTDRPKVQPVQEIAGQVVDLDADPNGDLWVLENRDCREAGGENGCVWLGKFTDPSQSPEAVVDEQNHYSDLNLGNLTFAQQTDNILTLAGPAGVYTYDTRLHTWGRLVELRVITVLPFKNGDGFYFAQPSGVGVVRRGSLEATWEFPDPNDLIIKLLYGHDNEILALTQLGNLYSILTQSGEFSMVYEQGETTIDPTHFTSAVAITDTVLFTSPDGVLLHNTRQRLYDDIARDEAPYWLLDPDARLIGSGGDVYALVPNFDQNMNVYALPGSQVVTPDYFRGGEISSVRPYQVPGPLQSTWTWDDKGIGVLAADGSVYHLTVRDTQRATGAALSAQDRGLLSDVVGSEDAFAAIIGDSLKLYNLDTRTWISPSVRVSPGEGLEELLAVNGHLLLRTSQGRLIDDQGDVLIGSEQAFGINDEDLSDVTDHNQYLYLAGNGRVEQYDMDARETAKAWQIDDTGDVSLRGIINSRPLALVNGQAALGETILSPRSGEVTNLSHDPDFVWTVRENDENLYLMGHDQDDVTSFDRAHCYFRNPTAGSDVSQVYDARALPNSVVAVLTNAGLKFYNLRGRTWHDGPARIPQADRIHYFDYPRDQGYLLLVTSQITGTVNLTFIKTNDIEIPHTCSTSSVDLKISQSEKVRAVSVNESAARVAWIATNGEVVEWQAGQERGVIGPETSAPVSTALRRVFDRHTNGYLLFTTDASIWRYDLGPRTWTMIRLDFPGGRPSIANINIEPHDDDNIITVRTTNSRFYYGILSATGQAVNLQPLIDAGDIELSGVDADALLDVQMRAEDAKTWTIVLNDRILYFDPDTRTWEQLDTFPSDGTLSYQRVLDRGLILGDSQTSWWIAQNPGPHPRHFVQYRLTASDQQAALTSDGHVWRLSEDGELFKCIVTIIEGGEEYVCEQVQVPFTLNPDDIVHAFNWRHLVFFETLEGLRAFDKLTGEARTLPADVASFNVVTASYAPKEDQLFLYSDNNNRLLIFDNDGATVFEDILDLLLDKNKDLWARFPDGWQHYNNRIFSSPKTNAGLTAREANIRLFAAWNSEVTGIAPDGTPYYWTGSVLMPANQSLPRNIVPDSVDWLIRDPQDAWWVLSGGILVHAISGKCVSLNEPYPIATAEYLANLRATVEATIVLTVTPEISRTLLTPTPSPSPTVTATPIPCYYVIGEIVIPVGNIIEARALENGVELADQTGQTVRVTDVGLGQYDVSTSTITTTVPAFSLDDQWDVLQSNLYTLPNGKAAYDPITQLVIKDKRQLVALRLSAAEHELADTGAFPDDIELPPALDVSWLRWNRDGQSFTVNTGSGRRDFTKHDFIDNGQFLFESVDSVLAKSEEEFHVANRYGLWVYTQPNLNLNDEKITFYPVSLSLPIIAAHGHFLTGSDMVRVDQNTVVRDPIRNVAFDVGDVHLTERIQLPTVEATVTVSGEDLPAFATNGFIWDVDRRALAYSGTDLLLQSDVGIHPATDQYTGFDAGPQRLALTTGVLQSDSGGNVYFLDSAQNAWYQYDGSAWRSNVQNPHANRTLLQNNIWEWTLRNGHPNVNLTGAVYNFAVTTRDGFGFNSDHLLAATSFQDALYVATDAFLEIAKPASQISNLQAPRTNPVTVDRLETFRFADGSTELYRYDGGTVFRWGAPTGQFVPNAPNPDPEQQRSLVTANRLRFTWDTGRMIKEVLVDDLAGNSTWVAYDFVNQRFPIDYVTSIAYFDNQLNVGTAAGLEVYSNTVSCPLSSLIRLYDMRNPPTGILAPVSDVGIPASDLDLLIARARTMCIERRSGQPFRQCVDPSLLYPKLRFSNHLWHWVTTAQGEVVGQYYDDSGSLDPEPIDIDEGRLPHDRIHDVTICEDRAFTMWDRRWVTVYHNNTLALQPTLKSYPLDDLLPVRFICVEKDMQLDSVTVRSGTYLETADHQLWVYHANTWKPVTDSQMAEKVYDYAANRLLFDRDRLRLRRSAQDDTPFEFEHLGQDHLWRAVLWQFDRIKGTWNVAIDDWDEIIIVDGQTWAATPLGFVTVERHGSGEAYIDANNVALVREPQVNEAVCPITDLKLQDGTVFVRCSADSLQVYQGDLTALRPTGAFTLFDGTDPFAEQILITAEDTGYWELRLTGREGSYPGNLEVYLHGEPMQLVGGRFNFDMLDSLALFRNGLVELATDGAGWFQAPRQHVYIADLERPSVLKNAADFNAVGVTHDGDELLLCLATNEGNYVRLDADMTAQQTASCPEYAGIDGFWLYLQDDKDLRVTAPASIGGRAQRHLAHGRFTDDTAIGLPTTALRDGDLSYWLPTRAGVIEMDADFRRINLHVGRFDGLEEGQVPTVLYTLDGRTPTYLGYVDGPKLYRLGETRIPLTGGLWFHPSPVEVRAIDNSPDGLLRIRWTDESGNGWSYVDLSDLRQADNSFMVYVGDFDKYHIKEQALQGMRPEMISQFAPDQVTFTLDTLRPYSVDLPDGFELVEAVVSQNRILVVGQQELLDINQETILGEIVALNNLGR